LTRADLDELFERDIITEAEYKEFWRQFNKIQRKRRTLGVPPLKTIREQLAVWLEDKKLIEPIKKVFSFRFPTFAHWLAKTTSKTSAYQKRIQRYLARHPGATLKEARGHK